MVVAIESLIKTQYHFFKIHYVPIRNQCTYGPIPDRDHRDRMSPERLVNCAEFQIGSNRYYIYLCLFNGSNGFMDNLGVD